MFSSFLRRPCKCIFFDFSLIGLGKKKPEERPRLLSLSLTTTTQFLNAFVCNIMATAAGAKVPPPTPSLNKIIDAIRAALPKSVSGSLPAAIFVTGVTGYTLYKGIYFVPGGHRAVKFNALTGLHNTSYGEGANLAIPYVETPVVLDIRNRAAEISSSSGSRDLQNIDMSVRVLYKPNVEYLHDIYRNLGVNYADMVLPNLINEVVKAVIAGFNAGELLARRQEVSNRIFQQLQHRAGVFHIDISDVSITEMTFGKEYTSAVEAKQIAQQMAERAKFQVEQALQEKKGAILLAEGEAQAASLIGEAMNNNPGFIKLRRLEAQKAVAKAVAQGKGQFLLDSATLGIDAASALTTLHAPTAGDFGTPTGVPVASHMLLSAPAGLPPPTATNAAAAGGLSPASSLLLTAGALAVGMLVSSSLRH